MRYLSAYLSWYIHVPTVKHDFKSSGILHFKHDINLCQVDLSANYAHGNPKIIEILAERYKVKPENVFISSEGASGQNARIIRYLAEKTTKREAVVEYPTYEPLLRQVQEHFPHVKRLERKEKNGFKLDADQLRKTISKKTALLVLTNPHVPSGTVSDRKELKEIMQVANEFDFFVLCDEIYGEFDRNKVPTLFSVDPERGITTTSFTKAYGLGGLKLGAALTTKDLVDELFTDVLNTVGNSPNAVQLITSELLGKNMEKLEKHKQKWLQLKNEAEYWLNKLELEYSPNSVSITYWTKLPINDTHKWVNEHAIPNHSIAPVPGAFFLFNNSCKPAKSNMIRIGLGAINPEKQELEEAFKALDKALRT